jgi:hypothetical protein
MEDHQEELLLVLFASYSFSLFLMPFTGVGFFFLLVDPLDIW